MGKVVWTKDGAALPLYERNIVGRSRVSTLRIDDLKVSGEHALLRWSGRSWELQDLGSRNGTFVGGRRIAVGERVALDAGVVLGFGCIDGHVLASAQPPGPWAVPLDGGPPVEAEDGLLALLDLTAPTLTVHRSVEDGWTLEQAGETNAVEDGAVVRLPGGAWRLHLPDAPALTEDTGSAYPAIETIGLRFRVSRDEETVELTVLHAAREYALKTRVHHYTLLLLARTRLRDAELAPDRQGWIEQAELLRLLRCDSDRLYLDIFRARRQLATVRVREAARLIERRVGTGLLRLGVGWIDIVPLLPL